jgi:hypothetical protein
MGFVFVTEEDGKPGPFASGSRDTQAEAATPRARAARYIYLE